MHHPWCDSDKLTDAAFVKCMGFAIPIALIAIAGCGLREYPPRIPEEALPGAELLTPGNNDSYRHPAWSPDGRYLAYEYAPFITGPIGDPAVGNRDIYVMDLASKDTLRLTESEAEDRAPAWSPDGSRILFVQEEGRLMWVSPNGSEQQELFQCPRTCGEPSWSPDGSQIAFDLVLDDGVQIWVVASDGTGLRQVTTVYKEAGDPTWSPDGSQLAYWAGEPGGYRGLVKTDLASGEETPLWGDIFPANPQWSPDGMRILYSDVFEPNVGLYIVDTIGTAPFRLLPSELPFDVLDAAWSPDGARIAFAYGNASSASHLYVLDLDKFAGRSSALP